MKFYLKFSFPPLFGIVIRSPWVLYGIHTSCGLELTCIGNSKQNETKTYREWKGISAVIWLLLESTNVYTNFFLLRCNWYITLCKFKVYNVMIW